MCLVTFFSILSPHFYLCRKWKFLDRESLHVDTNPFGLQDNENVHEDILFYFLCVKKVSSIPYENTLVHYINFCHPKSQRTHEVEFF